MAGGRIRRCVGYSAVGIFILLAARHSLLAAFRDSGFGTRAAGMGGAYAAFSDDADGPLYNPAGLGRLENREVTFMVGKPYLGLDLAAGADGTTSLGQNYLSAVYPTARFGSFGLSWANFGAKGLYEENAYGLSYGRRLHDLFWKDGSWEIYGGLGVKSLSHAYELDDRTRQTEATSARSPFREGTSASALSFDAGLQVKPAAAWIAGLSVRHLNSPDVGLQQKDAVPRELRLGGAWLAGDRGPFEDLTPTVEISYRKPEGNDADFRPHFGAEAWFNFHTYALRAGGNDREFSLGGSWARDLPLFSIQLDYAFVLSTELEDNSGTHRLSFSIRQAAGTDEAGETEESVSAGEEETVSVEPDRPAPGPERTVPLADEEEIVETADEAVGPEPDLKPSAESSAPATEYRPRRRYRPAARRAASSPNNLIQRSRPRR